MYLLITENEPKRFVVDISRTSKEYPDARLFESEYEAFGRTAAFKLGEPLLAIWNYGLTNERIVKKFLP